MGYVYAIDAASGKLVWKTKVGVHNGHDDDGTLALQHKLPKLTFPLNVEPGIVGGVETNMAVADGVVYVPVANLASQWKTRDHRPRQPRTSVPGTGEMLALDLATGQILWDTKLPQMADGDATVVNDLVFTTTFDGHLIAFDRETRLDRLEPEAARVHERAGRGRRRHADHGGELPRRQGPDDRGDRVPARRARQLHAGRAARPRHRPAPRTAPRSSRRTAPPATRSPPPTRRAPSARTSTS